MRKKINLKKIEKFKDIFKFKVNDTDLLIRALVHRSFVNESKLDKNNERLEFLGDAVLELIITKHLFFKYPSRDEGELTSFRAAIVKTESLAQSARRINLGHYILMSKGEESTGGRDRSYILANTFESILGFIYLDQNYERAEEFVQDNLLYKLDNIVKNRLDIDNKSKLQEISQEYLKITPAYEVISESGPDHSKTFEIAVKIRDHIFGSGKGSNKQEAAQNAAQKALEQWDEKVKRFYQ
jgi:ribonuclease-3